MGCHIISTAVFIVLSENASVQRATQWLMFLRFLWFVVTVSYCWLFYFMLCIIGFVHWDRKWSFGCNLFSTCCQKGKDFNFFVQGKRFTYRFNFRELSPYGAAAGLIDKDEASPLPSPCYPISNSNGNDRDHDSLSDRIPTGIPGPLKSPLPGLYPYGSINQNILAARSLLSRNLAAGLAQLPGNIFLLCYQGKAHSYVTHLFVFFVVPDTFLTWTKNSNRSSFGRFFCLSYAKSVEYLKTGWRSEV